MTPIDPTALRPHYRRFLRKDRILLTGHSHQAWPDAAERGLLDAFADAAEHVDDKWTHATARADTLRRAIAAALTTPTQAIAPTEIALATNSHELTTRLLSALDWRRGRHLVTTDGEFHSLRRQLTRLAEAGADISFIPVDPITTLAARMAEAIRPDTIGLFASTVLYRTAAIVPHLEHAITAAHRVGAAVLLDAYHAFNVVPQPAAALGPDPIFITGGGYKYAQWGEGCCWLRVPPDCELRPIHTGWFSDFAGLTARQTDRIGYGTTGADRFAGSTYDPASHYRAAAVIDFFTTHHLTVDRLRALSQHQTTRLTHALTDLDLQSPRDPQARGGFITLRHPAAQTAVTALRARGIYTDARDDLLRLGPAPYTTDDELDTAAAAVRDILRR